MRRIDATALVAGLVLVGGVAILSPGRAEQAAPNAQRLDPALAAAIAGSWRTPANVARDRYRHPAETLAFFGVKPTDTVIEISPGTGWYSEILAPFLRERGQYIAAVPTPGTAEPTRGDPLAAMFTADPSHYDKVEWLGYDRRVPLLGRPGRADVVLTFRNVHNWVAGDNADAYFKAFYDALKPGGTLGVVDHRARPGTDLDTMKKSGYVTELLVIDQAARAGFVLEAGSQANANPKDTADHPDGVWTLPPTNRHDPADDAKYRAIGESDRMTLRFVKPKNG